VSTDPQRDPPPVGEEIHLPGASLIPVLTAFGIAVALVGVTTTWLLTIAGGVLTAVCVVRWIRDTRRDVSELPLDH
jgi:Flp pilus assembly protein TadB